MMGWGQSRPGNDAPPRIPAGFLHGRTTSRACCPCPCLFPWGWPIEESTLSILPPSSVGGCFYGSKSNKYGGNCRKSLEQKTLPVVCHSKTEYFKPLVHYRLDFSFLTSLSAAERHRTIKQIAPKFGEPLDRSRDMNEERKGG